MAFDFRVRSPQEFIDRYGDESPFYTATLYPDREAWLEGRRGHIGASDAWKVLDGELSKQLFEEMTGKRQHEDLSDNEYVQRGIAAEEHIRALLAIENPDWEVFDGTHLIFKSKRLPFATASLDCIMVSRTTGEIATCELKEAPWSAKWKGPYAPNGYFAQGMHQHYVTGWERWFLHPRIYSLRPDGLTTSFERVYDFYMTDEAIASQVDDLMTQEAKFMERVQAGDFTPVLNLESIF